jgi:hypothetical protein
VQTLARRLRAAGVSTEPLARVLQEPPGFEAHRRDHRARDLKHQPELALLIRQARDRVVERRHTLRGTVRERERGPKLRGREHRTAAGKAAHGLPQVLDRRFDLYRVELRDTELERDLGIPLGEWWLAKGTAEISDRGVVGSATASVGRRLAQCLHGFRIPARLAGEEVNRDAIARSARLSEHGRCASVPRRPLACAQRSTARGDGRTRVDDVTREALLTPNCRPQRSPQRRRSPQSCSDLERRVSENGDRASECATLRESLRRRVRSSRPTLRGVTSSTRAAFEAFVRPPASPAPPAARPAETGCRRSRDRTRGRTPSRAPLRAFLARGRLPQARSTPAGGRHAPPAPTRARPADVAPRVPRRA